MTEVNWKKLGEMAKSVARKSLVGNYWLGTVDVNAIAEELAQEAVLKAFLKNQPFMTVSIVRGLAKNWSKNETKREEGRVRPKTNSEGEEWDPSMAVPSNQPSSFTMVILKEEWEELSTKQKMAALKRSGECMHSAECMLGLRIHKTVWAKL